MKFWYLERDLVTAPFLVQAVYVVHILSFHQPCSVRNQKTSFLDFWNNTKIYIYRRRNLESVHYLINFGKNVPFGWFESSDFKGVFMWKFGYGNRINTWMLPLSYLSYETRPVRALKSANWFFLQKYFIVCLDFANGHKRQLILLLSCLSFEHFFLKCFFL